MPIRELPKATSRLISSSLVLRTPVSLVKELLENALDAKATSVDIAISTDTLDKIEVRDNGHGITPEDLKLIGKRGYTSKVCNFDEVMSLGGRSLGFRGEALASALELGNISITTRVEGEAVATKAKLDVYGGISSQVSISHPVGTTVCCTELFSTLPVRKQAALKDAKKTLVRIKEMLQSYALARCTIRLTLKVFKTENSNWSFAPRPNEGFREVLSCIAGRETSLQCVQIISTFPVLSQINATARALAGDTLVSPKVYKSPDAPPQSGLTIQALLPKPDADLTKVHGSQYISVDSRPISCARGTSKKIISMYKSIISAMLLGDVSKKLRTPFMSLNIFCPTGSYDPNIEPAKDDVLFENERVLLSLLEAWFSSIYGDRILAAVASHEASTKRDKPFAMTDLIKPIGVFSVSGDSPRHVRPEIDIIRMPDVVDENSGRGHCSDFRVPTACVMTGQGGLPTSLEVLDAPPAVCQMRSGLDMSEDCFDDMELDETERRSPLHHKLVRDMDDMQSSHVSQPLNPWTIAELNNSLIESKILSITPIDSVKRSPNNAFSKTQSSSESYSSRDFCNRGPTKRRINETGGSMEQQPGSIEGWLRRSSGVSHENPIEISGVRISLPTNSKGGRALVELGNEDMSTDMSTSGLQSPPSRQTHLAATVPQIVDGLLVSQPGNFRVALQSTVEARIRGLPPRRPQFHVDVDMTLEEEAQDFKNRNERNLEIHEALDFERRKEAATRKLRQQIRQSQSCDEVVLSPKKGRITSSPHKNRYCAAVAVLERRQNQSTMENIGDKLPQESCLPDDDPRAYLMRRQRSLAAYSGSQSVGRKLKRVKTMLLPLENIPEKAELYGLCQLVSMNVGVVRQASLRVACHDQYIKSGIQAKGLLMSEVDVQMAGMKLDTLFRHWVQATASDEVDVVLDLVELRTRKELADI